MREVLAFGRWSVGAVLCPARRIFSFCLRRVTFFLWRKKVTKERHSRGKGFRFPFPLENPPSLSDQRGRAAALPLWKHPPGVWAIIKSRLCREAAKVGGGLWPPFERRSCHETKNHTAPHFRVKAAALRGAETMQHLGEVCTAQRSRGKSEQDKRQVKARKGFSNRRFERRFWVLLPPRAKVPRAGARNILLDNPSVNAAR